MQQAVPAGQGAMAVVLGLEMDAVGALCADAAAAKWCRRPILTAAGQVVIAGGEERC